MADMKDGFRTKVQSKAVDEINRFIDLGNEEKRMLDEGDFVGLQQYLKERAQGVRRSVWFAIIGFTPVSFLIGWSLFRDLINSGSGQAFIFRLLIIVVLWVAGTGLFLRISSNRISRTDQILVYVSMLADTNGDRKGL